MTAASLCALTSKFAGKSEMAAAPVTRPGLKDDLFPLLLTVRPEASASSCSSCLSHIARYCSSDIPKPSLRAVSIVSGLARTLYIHPDSSASVIVLYASLFAAWFTATTAAAKGRVRGLSPVAFAHCAWYSSSLAVRLNPSQCSMHRGTPSGISPRIVDKVPKGLLHVPHVPDEVEGSRGQAHGADHGAVGRGSGCVRAEDLVRRRVHRRHGGSVGGDEARPAVAEERVMTMTWSVRSETLGWSGRVPDVGCEGARADVDADDAAEDDARRRGAAVDMATAVVSGCVPPAPSARQVGTRLSSRSDPNHGV